MKIFSKEEIQELIVCSKKISEAPKKEMKQERGSLRNDLRLVSEDGSREFKVFMRVNEDFSEDFSIGLSYILQDEPGTITLFRCNGPHGDVLGIPPSPHSHFHYHIHKAKADNIEAGLRPERGAEITNKYASYQQALAYFLRKVNVVDADEYFSNVFQMTLDLKIEEPGS